MTKIIGFLITKETVNFNIDFFNVGIKTITIKYNNYSLYLWGMGEIENYKINAQYSLSFPIHDSLLDRNILISFENDNIVIENDWLGSIPVFYNQKEKIVSTLSNFCLKDKTIHNEGLANFCEFGYSVFEQTIFDDVKFMRYFSKLTISDKKLELLYKEDPALESSFLAEETDELEVIDLMQNYISNIESKIDGDIVLPTSGGYDSRILNYFIKDKNRIQSFTYGISADQSQSTEVVHAKKISEIYDTNWEQIELKDYHDYIDDWVKIFGFSTHLHGMYQIEFYTKILSSHKFSNPSFLSGIIGDAWAELGKFKDISTYQELIHLGYTHGICLDPHYAKAKNSQVLKKHFFDEYTKDLQSDKLKAIFAMRTKLMLISYLTQLPEYFGMPVWTPFLNFEIVKNTINLPDDRRKKRIWQKDFFKTVNIDLENMKLKSQISNQLSYTAAQNTHFTSIDIEKMKFIIDANKLLEINNTLITPPSKIDTVMNELLAIPKVGGVLRLIGFKNKLLKAVYEYYVVKSIEKCL